jgi:hypothetical protein
MRVYAAAVVAATVACNMPQYTPASAPSGPGGTSETTGASAPSSGGSAPSGAPTTPTASKAPVPTTVEIHSDCSKTVPVFYGEKPKFGSGTKSSVSSNSTSSTGRNSDGTLTVWIIDEQENGIASVHVGPETRRVEIDSSCKRITAR